MKLVKMSLVAAVLVGASAFAVDNVKVSGSAEVLYSTTDAKNQLSNVVAGGTAAATKSGTLFDKDSSAADAGLNLNISADLAKNSLVTVSAGAGYTVLSTLGLENNFVSNVWGSAHQATTSTSATYGNNPSLGALDPKGAKVNNANWMNEAWVAVSLNAVSKSTVKVGRMELDTPLAFTEKWSIEKNTFEGAVLLNQDLPDTTIVAAYIGNGNGDEAYGYDARSNIAPYGGGSSVGAANSLAMGGVVNRNGEFTTYGLDGAYTVAAINNSWKPLTAQAWYYDVSKMAHAYWLQADLDASSLGVAGVTAGVQYADVALENKAATLLTANTDSSTTVAGKLGYAMKDMFAASVAYSQVSTKGSVGAANTATATGYSKLYTEAWWNYGQVSALGARSWNVTVTSPVNGLFDAGLYITSVDQTKTPSTSQDMTEVTVTAGKKFGPLDATLAYINTSFNHKATPAATKVSNQDSNTVQAYLTLNF